MLYSLEPSKIEWKQAFKLNSALDNGLAKLEAYLGVRQAENGGPVVQNLLLEDPEFINVFERVCRTGKVETFDLSSRPTIAETIMEEVPEPRGFGDQPRLAALLPIESITRKGVNAVLIVGTNTRRPYDADFEFFMRDLGRSVSSMLAALILTNEQKRRVAGALQAEKRAVSMLEASPVGSCLIRRDGVILYVNSSWHTITGYTYDNNPFGWLEMMTDASALKAQRAFTNVVERGQEVTVELALKKPWSYTDSNTGETVTGQTYILVSALLQRLGDEDYVISVVTDISYQKWMESLQDQRRQQALEMKRAQENFMDVTSHEMRNPLSAIFQCADAIINSLSAFQQQVKSEMPELTPVASRDSQQAQTTSYVGSLEPKVAEAIAHAVENAGTIALCAQHQRRIVDDVLVLSKVDARLIEIHPVEVQPRVLLENAIKMFAAELAANKARMTLEIEQSFIDLQVDWVKLDPGRLLQILINLCTNAIKFTMDSQIRKISIQVGASTTIPTHSSRGVRYLHGVNEEAFEDPTTHAEWGDGEVLYLSFQVTDTGQGMTPDEMKLLFQRASFHTFRSFLH
jgi:signal transduction histidine kinase